MYGMNSTDHNNSKDDFTKQGKITYYILFAIFTFLLGLGV